MFYPKDPIKHAAHVAKLREVNAHIRALRDMEACGARIGSAIAATLALAFIVVMSACGPTPPAPAALIAPPPSVACEVTWAQLFARANGEHDGWHVTNLAGDAAQRFLAKFNAYPPVSDEHADEVHVVRRAGNDMAFVFFVTDGCVKEQATMKDSDVAVLLTGKHVPRGEVHEL